MFIKLSKFHSRAFGTSAAPEPLSPAPDGALDLMTIRQHLAIPIHDAEAESHSLKRQRDQGRHMARQEQWDELYALVRRADVSGQHGRLAVQLCEGAASDAIEASHSERGRALGALEAMAADNPSDYVPTMIAALALLLTAHDPQIECGAQFLARAEILLDRFDAETELSPSLACTQCRVSLALNPTPNSLPLPFTALLTLDPQATELLRTLGAKLCNLPEHREQMARRAMHLARDGLREGAYALLWMDGLDRTPEHLELICPRTMLLGIEKLVQPVHHAGATRPPSQRLINALAAFTGLTLAPGQCTSCGSQLSPRAERARAELHGAFSGLIHAHLRVLYPELWQPRPTPGRIPSQTSGPGHALRALARPFETQIRAGQRITFGPDGIAIHG